MSKTTENVSTYDKSALHSLQSIDRKFIDGMFILLIK